MGLPITIFCNDEDKTVNNITAIIDEFKSNIRDNIEVDIKRHVLTTHPHYNEIITNRRNVLEMINNDKEKNPNGFYWTRNEIICHTKLIFLKKVFDEYSDVNSAIWVDAGITHWGLNPRCFGGVEINGSSERYTHFYPVNSASVFTPKIGEGFKKLLTNNDMFLVGHKNNWYDSNLQWVQAIYVLKSGLKNLIDPDNEWIYNDAGKACRTTSSYIPGIYSVIKDPGETVVADPIAIFSKQIIGGVIGVTRSKIDHLYTYYYDNLKFLLDYKYKTLFTEEPMLSLYYSLYKPTLIEFSDWCHNVPHDPPNPCTTDGTFPRSFYKIWSEISDL